MADDETATEAETESELENGRETATGTETELETEIDAEIDSRNTGNTFTINNESLREWKRIYIERHGENGWREGGTIYLNFKQNINRVIIDADVDSDLASEVKCPAEPNHHRRNGRKRQQILPTAETRWLLVWTERDPGVDLLLDDDRFH